MVTREYLGERAYLSTHRATQEALLRKLNKEPDLRERIFRNTVSLLRESFPEPSNRQIADADLWPNVLRVLPHLQSLLTAFRRADPRMKGDLALAKLLSDVGGMDLYDRGRVTEAYLFSKEVIKMLNDLEESPESPLRSDALTIIGLCTDFMSLGRRVEGYEIRLECLDIRKKYHKRIDKSTRTKEDSENDEIRLYNSYTDLACSQQQLNQFDEVENNAELCYTEYKKWGTEEKLPYEYAKYYNHMAYVLLYRGEMGKAVEFAWKAVELVGKAAPGTQITTLYKFDWANILFQTGEHKPALKEHEAMLKSLKKECGKENIRTLKSRLNIGIIQYFIGHLEDAQLESHSSTLRNRH